MFAPRRTCLFVLAILAASVSRSVAGPTLSDYVAITDQKKVILQKGTITEAEETAAADQGKVLLLNFKIDVPTGNFMNGDFPTSRIHFLEPITGKLSDTIELMVVSTTPQTITFQLQFVSDGEDSNGKTLFPPALLNPTPVTETGSIQDLTVILFPKFYNPDGTETGKGPSPFRVLAASDVRGVLLLPEPSSLCLAAVAGLLGLGHVFRRTRSRTAGVDGRALQLRGRQRAV